MFRYISAKIATKRKTNITIERHVLNVAIDVRLGHNLDFEYSRSNSQFAISQQTMVWFLLIRYGGLHSYSFILKLNKYQITGLKSSSNICLHSHKYHSGSYDSDLLPKYG